MTIEQTQKVVDRFLEYDYSVLAEDAVGEIIGLGLRGVGPSGIEKAADRLYNQMFDATPDIRKVIVGESNGVVEFDFVGKHIGEFCGVPPTQNTVKVPSLAIYDIEGDAITGVRLYFPVNLVLDQLAPG